MRFHLLYHISVTDARATCKLFGKKVSKYDSRVGFLLTDGLFCGTIRKNINGASIPLPP